LRTLDPQEIGADRDKNRFVQVKQRTMKMDTQSAILALTQSEKIKAGLIWTSQTIEMVMGLPEQNKPGAEQIITALVSMVANEIHLGMKIAPNEHWQAALGHINNAIVMLNSKVIHDAPFHLSKALSHVTSIGQTAMTHLREHGLV
jgi:hypothetical protein